jgi:hypothetical protein
MAASGAMKFPIRINDTFYSSVLQINEAFTRGTLGGSVHLSMSLAEYVTPKSLISFGFKNACIKRHIALAKLLHDTHTRHISDDAFESAYFNTFRAGDHAFARAMLTWRPYGPTRYAHEMLVHMRTGSLYAADMLTHFMTRGAILPTGVLSYKECTTWALRAQLLMWCDTMWESIEDTDVIALLAAGLPMAWIDARMWSHRFNLAMMVLVCNIHKGQHCDYYITQ